MEPVTETDKAEKEKKDTCPKKIWDNHFGKAGITALSILGIALFIGGLFKVGEFTMNSYKDFRDAIRR